MKCLVLAAGYATRLYPLTENFPKPLLQVGNKTILDRLLDDIDAVGAVDEYVIVSNHRFAEHFECWAAGKPYPVTVIDDGSSSNETRLGAVRDMALALGRMEPEGGVLVIAGDNLLDFSLARFIAYAQEKGTSCVMRYYEPDETRLRRSGVIEADGSELVLRMEEKPAVPQSHWCCPPFYCYTQADARRIGDALRAGCAADAPGSFAAWLCGVSPVHAMEMPGRRYDIGTAESYELVKREYKGIVR